MPVWNRWILKNVSDAELFFAMHEDAFLDKLSYLIKLLARNSGYDLAEDTACHLFHRHKILLASC